MMKTIKICVVRTSFGN